MLIFGKMADHLCHYSGPEPQTLPLPPELIVRTLSYLDQACDKRNARLVCRGFAAAGLSSLTSTAYFSISIINIHYSANVPSFSSPTREIAMHPILSKYITKLVCDGTQLPHSHLELQAFKNWWATLEKNPTSRPIEKIHSLYSSRYQQENWIIGKGEDQKSFRTAVEQFVKLRCVVITDIAANKESRDWPRPTWPEAVPNGDL